MVPSAGSEEMVNILSDPFGTVERLEELAQDRKGQERSRTIG